MPRAAIKIAAILGLRWRLRADTRTCRQDRGIKFNSHGNLEPICGVYHTTFSNPTVRNGLNTSDGRWIGGSVKWGSFTQDAPAISDGVATQWPSMGIYL